MKIGILGGTFDPIHNAHLALGRYAKKEFDLDQIWIMPNGNPPHKSDSSIESKTAHRVEMVRLAIANEKDFYLQLYEVERTETNYSYLTMQYFNKTYPEHEFYFIIGADSLFALESWKHPEQLLESCIILAAYRNGKDAADMKKQIQYLNHKFNADIRLLHMPDIDISSTEIRDDLKKHQSIQALVPKAVFDYIVKNQLFKDDENESI